MMLCECFYTMSEGVLASFSLLTTKVNLNIYIYIYFIIIFFFCFGESQKCCQGICYLGKWELKNYICYSFRSRLQKRKGTLTFQRLRHSPAISFPCCHDTYNNHQMLPHSCSSFSQINKHAFSDTTSNIIPFCRIITIGTFFQ